MWGVRVFVTLYVLAVALLAPALLFAADDQPLQSNQTQPSQSTPGAPPAPGAATPAAPADPSTASTTAPPISATPPPVAAQPPPTATSRKRVHAARGATSRAVAHAAATDTIVDFSFSPKTITITEGEAVTWHNEGPTGHSATSDTGDFDTGVLATGGEGAHTFDTPGTYAFHCQPHPYMKGTVRVIAKTSGSGDAGGSNGSSNTTPGAGGEGSSSNPSAGASGGNGSSSGSRGSGLAATGLDVALLALLGIGLLCCGAGLRLRLAARDQRASD